MSLPRKLEWLWLLGKKTWWFPIQSYYHYIALLHTSCRSCKMASKSLYVLLIWLVRSDAKAKTVKEALLFKIWIEFEFSKFSEYPLRNETRRNWCKKCYQTLNENLLRPMTFGRRILHCNQRILLALKLYELPEFFLFWTSNKTPLVNGIYRLTVSA